MVRTYEMMAVLAPDIAEEEMPAALERISGYITTNDGEVTELVTTSPWGRRRLAYEIRDYRDGFYALYHFNLDPSRVGEVERELRLNNQVLRSLVVSYAPPKPKKPKKGKAGEQAEGEASGEAGASAEAAEIVAPSGAAMDTPPQEATGPDGEDLNAPPTAETPAADEESESEPAR
jgi:small subunit ribosomal protein S6